MGRSRKAAKIEEAGRAGSVAFELSVVGFLEAVQVASDQSMGASLPRKVAYENSLARSINATLSQAWRSARIAAFAMAGALP